MFAKILSSFLPKEKWILIMDRTNWKFGKVDINFLVLSVAYKGIAIPILWYILKNNKNEKRKLIVVVTNIDNIESIKLYKRRWEIETMFGAFKSKGLNLEETHMQDYKKLTLLFGIISLAFVWCYHIGIKKAKIKHIKTLKHGYKEKSYSMFGLEFLSQLFSDFYFNAKKIKIVFDFFVSKLTNTPFNSAVLERMF